LPSVGRLFHANISAPACVNFTLTNFMLTLGGTAKSTANISST